MESIEKLRKTANGDSPFWCAMVRMFTDSDGMSANDAQSRQAALSLADEIEREIAERYMLLPVDADGVPIHYGDTLEHHSEYGDYIEKVCNMEFCERIWNAEDWLVNIGIWVNPSETRHAKPRTIEDVLDDFLHDAADRCEYANGWLDECKAKYADELRSMGVGE